VYGPAAAALVHTLSAVITPSGALPAVLGNTHCVSAVCWKLTMKAQRSYAADPTMAGKLARLTL